MYNNIFNIKLDLGDLQPFGQNVFAKTTKIKLKGTLGHTLTPDDSNSSYTYEVAFDSGKIGFKSEDGLYLSGKETSLVPPIWFCTSNKELVINFHFPQLKEMEVSSGTGII